MWYEEEGQSFLTRAENVENVQDANVLLEDIAAFLAAHKKTADYWQAADFIDSLASAVENHPKLGQSLSVDALRAICFSVVIAMLQE